MKNAVVVLVLISLIALTGCTGVSPAGNKTSGTGPYISDHGFVLNGSIRPGDDFFGYVNDAWIRDHPIPADKSSVSSFSELSDKVDEDLLTLSLKAANTSSTDADRNLALIGQFYRSGTDTVTIGREGILPLKGDLAMIDAIGSRDDLTNATIVLLTKGSGPVYSYYAEVNPRNSTEMIPGLEQGGLGLPDRDYYLRNDTKSLEIQDAYLAHITRVFVLMGEPDGQAATDAKTVYSIEKNLAEDHFSNEENRVPEDTTNIYPISDLEKQYPAIGWDYLRTIPGSGPVTRVNIHQPRYVKGLNSMILTAPLDDWKVYLRYHLINDASPYLSAPFEQESFDFYSRILFGTTEMKPRWKRIVNTESELLGNPVGREYVQEYVDPRTRTMVTGMFSSIRTTLDERITNATWMSTSTKAAARGKLAAMGQKIAYPDQWMDYSGLDMSGAYISNVRSASAYLFIHGPEGLDKIGRPLDENVWFMSPQTVNAYYDPTRNEMVFPAAILEPPFFDPDADSPVNYGGIGWVIAHEMTHGFDDQGRQFDKDGNLKDWWTKEDARNFNNRTALLVTEYNGFEVLPGLYGNGNLTLGENIADFGGATLAYHAWRNSENRSYGTASSDTTADRQFFFGAARVWRETARDDALRSWVYTDPHSANKYRVNGVVFNIPEFYEAFPEVLPGDALYRNVSERPVIW